MPIKKKRVRLSVEEKIWILNHRKENPMISQNKIALDFSVKVSESLQKLCYEIDQMYIEQDFSFETETRDLILVGENDEDEMVTLEFIPEIEEQKLPEKPQIQSCITQFFKNNK